MIVSPIEISAKVAMMIDGAVEGPLATHPTIAERIAVLVRSPELAAAFDARFSAPAEVASEEGRPPAGVAERVKATAFGAISPLL